MVNILYDERTSAINKLRRAEKEDVALVALKEFGRALMQKGVVSSCYIQSAQVNSNPQVDACDYDTYYFLKIGSEAIARMPSECRFVYVKDPYIGILSREELSKIFGDNGYVASWDYNTYCLVRNTGIPQECYEV